MKCLLCESHSAIFFFDQKTSWEYFHCRNCDLRFLDPKNRLGKEEEKRRYQLHQNDVNDSGYQNFVTPLLKIIKEKIDPDSLILDYGCGDGPVLTHLLKAEGFSNITLFDLYFKNSPEALDKKYDLIFSTEVIEHFYNPAEEFFRLKNLLRDGGQLAVMTLFYSEEINFAAWPYRKDFTHVCFYSRKTCQWINSHFKFNFFTQFGDRIGWWSS